MSKQSTGIKIFIVYSHQDEDLKQRLEVHLTILKHQEYISSWNDSGKIIAGENFDRIIKKEMETSDIILLLVSPAFLASEYIIDVELKQALELHRRKKTWVIPVILKDCDWGSLPPLNELGVLPAEGKPVGNTQYWNNYDEAFTDILIGIKKTITILDTKIIHPPSDPFKVDAPNYIIRPADNQLDLLLDPQKPSLMCLIIGGIQCGKTSLLRRFKARVQKEDYPAIHVDFQGLGNAEKLTPGKVFKFISQRIDEATITRKIARTPEKKGEMVGIHWSKEALFEYLKENLEKDEKSFLIIDSMDALLSQSQDQETLNELIRWLYMLRTHQAESPFNRLTTIAAMTTLGYSAVKQSPLRTQAANIPLSNFGRTEIENLLRIYGIDIDIKQTAEEIFKLFGGQPLLSHLAVFDLSVGINFQDIIKRAVDPINGYNDYWSHLKDIFNLVLKMKNFDKNMVSVFKTLILQDKTPDHYKVVIDLSEELYLLGIIDINHELFSDFIDNAIRKEIQTK